MNPRTQIFIRIVSVISILILSPDRIMSKSVGEKAGDIGQVLIPASAYVATYIIDDTEGRHQFYKSFFTTMGLTYLLKYTIDRDRPEGHGENAFPSGHTAAAFQGAVFIQRRYGWTYGIPACIAAIFVGWSRIEVESDKHDTLDVCGGALLGTIASYFFTDRYEKVELTTDIKYGECCINVVVKW